MLLQTTEPAPIININIINSLFAIICKHRYQLAKDYIIVLSDFLSTS